MEVWFGQWVREVLCLSIQKRLALVAACLFLASCSQREAVTSIYEGLEQVAAAERAFETEQEPIMLLEKKEKVLYDTILSLGLHDTAERQELAIKAEESLEERECHLARERSGLYEAKKTFAKVLPLFDGLEEDRLKGCGALLTRAMQDRYGIYEQLYAQYERALQKDRELYDLLQSDAISFRQIQKQIEDINREYEQVLQLNQLFNSYTEQYNMKKEEFYKSAGLHIRRQQL